MSSRRIEAISDLTPDPRNARKHTPRNIETVVHALQEVGAARSIVIDEEGVVLAGNATITAAAEAGITKVRVVEANGSEIIAVRRAGLTPDQKKRLALFDNRAAEFAEWDADVLAAFQAEGLDLDGIFSQKEMVAFLASAGPREGLTEPDAIPERRPTAVRLGDVFELGRHVLVCGDTTHAETIRRAVGERAVALLHADPPYGMGKEADGIANDNLYGPKLDEFQLRWWQAWRSFLADNGSAYIWGNAPDLWRLWYVAGLRAVDDLLVRNEIVWDKGSGFGMSSDNGHSYPPATERCLFLMRGQQFLGNQNKADYWGGYEPLRSWLEAERDRAGWVNRDVNRLTGTQMAGHWFSQSQFEPISRKHYEVLRQAADGRAFVESYDDLFGRLFGHVRDGGNAHRRDLAEQLRAQRTYFDNTHEAMTDVWQYPRVIGEERFGHATPKPVAMVARALKSSAPEGGVVGVPFAGTGPEFIAGEQLGRVCVGVELEPAYCQIIIDRWEAFTGQKAAKVGEALDA